MMNYPLDTVDILVSCTDEQYQKNAFTAAGPALWKQNPQFCEAVAKEYLRLEKHIVRTHARKLGPTPAEAEVAYKRIKGDDSPGGSDQGSPVAAFDLNKFMNK